MEISEENPPSAPSPSSSNDDATEYEITKPELIVAGDFQVAELGHAQLPLRSDVEQIVAALDSDNDGKLSVNEVKALYSRLLGVDEADIPDDHQVSTSANATLTPFPTNYRIKQDVVAFSTMDDAARVSHLCCTMTAKEVVQYRIRAGLSAYNQEDLRKNPSARSGWDAFAAEVEEVYSKLAAQDDDDSLMSKEELVRAHQGDHGLFEQLDADADGNVTLEEWVGFCKENHAKKGKRKPEKGDNWLGTMLHTLESNLDHHETVVQAHVEVHVAIAEEEVAAKKEAEHAAAVAVADAAAARTGWEARAAEADDVFYRVAGIHEDDDGDTVLIDKGELVKATAHSLPRLILWHALTLRVLPLARRIMVIMAYSKT